MYIIFLFLSFCMVTEKERIDSGFFLYQAELKKKKEKRKEREEKVEG